MPITVGGGGTLPKDANNAPIQISQDFRTEDVSPAPPNVSPFNTIDDSVTTLTVPENAVAVIIRAVGADLRVGINTTLDGSATGKGYYLIPNGSAEAFGIAGCPNIRIKRDAAVDVAVSFRFEMLEIG